MAGFSRQVTGDTVSFFITIVWSFIILGVVYWFYRTLGRIEGLLQDIKKLLESKT